MFRFPESCMEMKGDAPGVSLTDGRQTTQRSLTDSETGNALEKQDGNTSKKKKVGMPLTFFSLSIFTDSLLALPYLIEFRAPEIDERKRQVVQTERNGVCRENCR